MRRIEDRMACMEDTEAAIKIETVEVLVGEVEATITIITIGMDEVVVAELAVVTTEETTLDRAEATSRWTMSERTVGATMHNAVSQIMMIMYQMAKITTPLSQPWAVEVACRTVSKSFCVE